LRENDIKPDPKVSMVEEGIPLTELRINEDRLRGTELIWNH
jgi:hypothetical protein